MYVRYLSSSCLTPLFLFASALLSVPAPASLSRRPRTASGLKMPGQAELWNYAAGMLRCHRAATDRVTSESLCRQIKRGLITCKEVRNEETGQTNICHFKPAVRYTCSYDKNMILVFFSKKQRKLCCFGKSF